MLRNPYGISEEYPVKSPSQQIGPDKADAPPAIALKMLYSVWKTDTVKAFDLIDNITLRVITFLAWRVCSEQSLIQI